MTAARGGAPAGGNGGSRAGDAASGGGNGGSGAGNRASGARGNGGPVAPDSPHAETADDVLTGLQADPRTGLSTQEAERRLQEWGRNELVLERSRSAWQILLAQVKSTVVVLLLAAVVAGLLIGTYVEAAAVGVVLVVNTIVGFVTEIRAVRSMEALRGLTSSTADVERDDRRDEVDATGLVPGDLVAVEAGDGVPADIRLVEAEDLATVEASLTGENAAVDKSVEPVDADAGVPDRHSMIFMGTTVVSGRGRGVVVATGRDTQMGRVATLVEQAEQGRAPLQEGLERLGRRLSLAVVGLTVVLVGIGLWRGLSLQEVLTTAIALAVAVVPEGLPAVATLTLAVGMRRMAARNALVSRLPTVETLGSTTVIASDKTGTLTTNVMEVVEVELADGVDERTLWETAVLVNDADLGQDGESDGDGDGDGESDGDKGGKSDGGKGSKSDRAGAGIGDPTEVALLVGAREAGLDVAGIRGRARRDAEEPFDAATKRMCVLVDGVVHVKGAPEVLLAGREDGPLNLAARQMGERALRTLAVARRRLDGAEVPEDLMGPAEDLELLGVVGMQDPPREAAIRAIETVQGAGIRVVMITGDLPRTARAVAEQVGIRADDVRSGAELAELDDDGLREVARSVDVFARISPEQKIRLVEALQDDGEVVAVTGDGVNDAPALRQADVGVAMGGAGTDVAREAADIVLVDDDFATIEAAVEEGRRIVANIRRFGQFLFSWHLGIVLVITAGLVAGLTAPLTSLMILWNNLVIDVLPSFALALAPGRKDAMTEPPRPRDEPVLGVGALRRIAVQGGLLASVGFGAYLFALGPLGLSVAAAQTTTFVVVTAAQLLAIFNARTERGNGFRGASRNPYLWIALAITVVLEALALGIPAVRDTLGLTVLPGAAWLVVLVLAPVPLVVTQTWRILRARG